MNASEAGFAELFSSYLGTSLRCSLTELRQQTSQIPDEMRLRAWHLLSYALRTGEAWPETRQLLLTLAPRMEQAGFREEWIAYLTSGVEIGTRHNDPDASAELALQIATLWRMLSEYDRAVQWLESSITGFRQVPDRRGEARALNELAWVEQLRRRYAEATCHVEQALALLDEDDPERGMSYRVQGMIAASEGVWQRAEGYHRAALESFGRQKEMRKSMWSIVNLGIALRGQKKYAEAIEAFMQASEMLKQLGDEYYQMVAQLNLGVTYYYCGDNSNAIPCYLQAEVIAQRLHDHLRLADIHLNLGLAYLGQAMYVQSSRFFRSAIREYTRVGIPNMVVNSMDGLAMSYIAQQQFEDAQSVLEEAIAILPQIADQPNHAYYQQSLIEHLYQAKEGLQLSFTPQTDFI